MLASIIERIEISKHPEGLATNLTSRKGEAPDAFAHRLDLYRAKVLRQRVTVAWWN
jgi:hypothetical protein